MTTPGISATTAHKARQEEMEALRLRRRPKLAQQTLRQRWHARSRAECPSSLPATLARDACADSPAARHTHGGAPQALSGTTLPQRAKRRVRLLLCPGARVIARPWRRSR